MVLSAGSFSKPSANDEVETPAVSFPLREEQALLGAGQLPYEAQHHGGHVVARVA
jgi:hypothetical protein